MALAGKIEADVQMKSPADKVHEFYTCTPYQITKSSPGKIRSVDLNQGKWGKEGSVYCWKFILDGQTATDEVKVGIDYKNNLSTYKTIGGTLAEMFKSFTISLQATPREQGSKVHWTIEYEKMNANVSDPNSMLQVIVDCCKDVDVYLIQKANTRRNPQLQYN